MLPINTEIDNLCDKLQTLDAEFDREMRARGFDPAQAENVALPSHLAELYAERAPIDISSPDDWPPGDEGSKAAWEQAKAALDRGHEALREAITRVEESRLDEPILEGMSTVYVTLHGVIQHDLYHAGQIAMLKKAL